MAITIREYEPQGKQTKEDYIEEVEYDSLPQSNYIAPPYPTHYKHDPKDIQKYVKCPVCNYESVTKLDKLKCYQCRKTFIASENLVPLEPITDPIKLPSIQIYHKAKGGAYLLYWKGAWHLWNKEGDGVIVLRILGKFKAFRVIGYEEKIDND